MAKRMVWAPIGGGIATAALVAVVAFAVPAAAETGGQAVAAGQSAAAATAGEVATDQTAPGPKALCDRLKRQEQKRQALQTRLSADASTRGSIAWLTAKAASATASGDQALAKLYTDKAALRSQLLDPLKTVTSDLDAVIAAKCG